MCYSNDVYHDVFFCLCLPLVCFLLICLTTAFNISHVPFCVISLATACSTDCAIGSGILAGSEAGSAACTASADRVCTACAATFFHADGNGMTCGGVYFFFFFFLLSPLFA